MTIRAPAGAGRSGGLLEGRLPYYAESGVTEVILRLLSTERDAVLPVLDEYSRSL